MGVKPKKAENFEKRHAELCELIREYDHAYYMLNESPISDKEYDTLIQELKDIEKNHPELKTPESPTQRVSGQSQEEFKKVIRSEKMMSLDNTYSVEETVEFFTKAMKDLNVETLVVVIEPKIDGLSIECVYENGAFILGATRGDGLIGEDVTLNLQTLRTLPRKLKGEIFPKITVRGEVYFDKIDFENFNSTREKEGLPLFKNPRNAASGSVRLLDAQETARRPLKVLFYNWLESPGRVATHTEVLQQLKKWGLPTHAEVSHMAKPEEIAGIVEKWEKKCAALPYETDGLVMKVDSLHHQDLLGVTSKFPKWAVAFKFEAEQAITRINAIRLQVGRTGVLTPVADLEPVLLAGTTVSRASLHNFDEILRKDVRIGDTVRIQKAGEIIPQILSVVVEERTGSETLVEVPTKCPECGFRIGKDKDEDVALKCLNGMKCSAQLKEYLRYFVSRQNLNIEGIGPALIDQLVDKKLIRDIADFFTLTAEQLLELERMGEKSATNVVESIEKAKREITLARWIAALGIPNVGTIVAQLLSKNFKSMRPFLDETPENLTLALEDILGIGPVMIESIVQYFQNADHRKVIEKMMALGIDPQHAMSSNSGKLAGKSFCMTGTLSKPRSDIQALILKEGGEVHATATKKTDFLLMGADVGENKVKQAKKNNVAVISEEQFNAMVN